MFSQILPHCNGAPLTKIARCFSGQAQNPFHDIIISGGGLIGQTMACALSKNPVFKDCSILLVESRPKKELVTPDSYSNRVSSIAPSTKDLFVKLGMWNNINRYQMVKDMKVWGSYSSDYVHFEHDCANPAYIIENDEIVNSAMLENTKAKNVTILYGKTVKEVNLSYKGLTGLHEIKLDDMTSFKTSLLIGADGANSSIRKAMDVTYIGWKYDQFGIVATLNLADESDNFTAWQRFLPEGPVAILPLEKGLSSLVWSVTEKKSKNLLQLPEEVFVDALNEALISQPQKNHLVDTLSKYSKSMLEIVKLKNTSLPLIPPFIKKIAPRSRACFPLSFGHSSEYVKPGVALIGDSAHKVHPLAGQGVNLGFRDIKCLEEKISQGRLDGRVIGHSLDLRHYESEAQKQNLPIMAAIDLFHWTYTSKNDLIRAIGNSCIHIADSLPPIKNAMRHLATN